MSDHILFAVGLNGHIQGAPLLDETAIIAALKAPELAWLHMRASHSDTEDWAEEHLAWLDPLALQALLAEETRPRATPIDNGVLVILRGVNLNPGQDPEDMVSIRLYIAAARIVSMSVRDLASVEDLRAEIACGQGPDQAGAFLCGLIDRLNDRIETLLHTLDEDCDAIEADLIGGADPELRARISDSRKQVILFRRHIAPQREALGQLMHANLGLFDPLDRRHLFEAHERLTRAVEDIDALRDRLAVVRDELQSALSERLNRNLYLLSIISVVFLPISFLTGLLGINVGGLPGTQSPDAFWLVCTGLVAVVAAVLLLLRRMKWI